MFEKDDRGDWYAVLPEYPGPKSDLQMVLGADTLCSILAQDQRSIEVVLDTERFDGCNMMYHLPGTLEEQRIGGATYWIGAINEFEYTFYVWLCDVVKFVFGEFPTIIYFK